MPAFTAFLDANVLYPAELRSILMYLAVTGLYRARWSADVHEEWISNLLANRPDLSREKLERTRELMDRHAPDALVSGYDQLASALTLPDPKDRHVLAAAIRGKADVVVTNNTRDFPTAVLDEFGLEAQTPDQFIVHLIGLYPTEVCNAAEEHRSSMRNPPRTCEEYLEVLRSQGLVETARILDTIWTLPA